MRKSSILVLFLAFLMLFVSACSSKPADKPQGEQAKGETGKKAGPPTFHGAWPYQVPPKGHFNTFVTDAMVLGAYADLIELPMAIYKWADNSYLPLLATSWKFEPPDKFSVELRQNVKNSDGSAFNAKDVITTFTVLRLNKAVIWRYIDKVEAQGDNKVVFHMSKPSTVVERYVLRERVRPASVYGDWVPKITALADKDPQMTSDEAKKMAKDFADFRPKELIGAGPFKIDLGSVNESQLTLTKVPSSWNADKIKFETIVLYNGETPTITPLVLDKQVDYATHGFPPATDKQFQQIGIRVIRPPTTYGPAIFFNMDVKPFARKEFRQAIAYAINREQNAVVADGQSGKAVKYMAGFSDDFLPKWLTPEQVGKLNQYPYDQKKAAEILTRIGYKKGSDGVWVSDTGQPLSFELAFPAEFADWSGAADELATQLNQFGIKTTSRGITFTQYYQDIDAGKFQIAVGNWGVGNPHPHFSLVTDLFTYNYPQTTQGKGINFPLQQKTESLGDVDLQQLVVDSADGLDEAKQKDKVYKAAQAFNELMPIVPIWERLGNNASLDGVRVTGWPPDSDPIWKNSVYADNPVAILLLEGRLQPAAAK